ncbi:CoA transferase [Salinadaptatus halalkaliphilus]|uniref:CoA transferase n=1 Tax=Salinadaptatus halalkaliphilus TaxID=2419781 RepID=A0A4S3TPN3_9EURY|nr:CoA transferase [Salinadaptatus halalkaliphilus]THE66329.1 CoA transferase [Salinadaptatus halalkaliphilus]
MPLSGFNVVDCGQAIAGPLCGTYLADLGADVVKIESPDGDVYRANRREKNGTQFNPAFEQYNRSKRSLCLDLKVDEGRALIHDLLKEADVFVQNWPPGVAERLELDYETVSELNEDIVYVHVTGYGETGPMATKPAMDTIVQHVSGLSNLMGYDDDRPPIRSQSSVADYYAACHATISALGALLERERNDSGGQKIDVSLLESLMHNMDGAFGYYHNADELPRHGGRNAFFNDDMLYGAAEASDGWICVALLLYSDRMWEACCELIGREDLLENPKYETDDGRLEDAAELSALFESWLADVPADEAVDRLNEVGIPAAHHNTVEDAANLEHVAEREVFTDLSHPQLGELTVTDTPLSLSETPTRAPEHAPVLGEHNRQILAELGVEDERIDELAAESVLSGEES